MKIKIILNNKKEWTSGIAEVISSKLESLGHRIVQKNADITITLGGDGTLLYNLDSVEGMVLPIGTSKSGFCIPFSDAMKNLESILNSPPVDAITLEAHIGKKRIGRAVNDIVFHTTDYRLHEFRLKTENSQFEFKGDGLIMATPLGSSSYNRSVGGAVIDRNLNAISVSAIAPYTTFYPKVMSAGDEYVVSSDSEMAVITDGWNISKTSEEVSVNSGDPIRILVPKRGKF